MTKHPRGAGLKAPVRLEITLVDGRRPSGVVSPTTCAPSIVGSRTSLGLGFVLGVLEARGSREVSASVRGWPGGNGRTLWTRDTRQGRLRFCEPGTAGAEGVRTVCIRTQTQVDWKCGRQN